MFEGVVIGRQGAGVRESFTVRKVSFGVGVERTFPLHTPIVEKIEVGPKGAVIGFRDNTFAAPDKLVGLIAEFFMYTADSAMVGRLGTDHLAAIGIATMFAELLWVIVWPFAPGTQALAARRFGRQKAALDNRPAAYPTLQHETGLVLDNALVVAFAAGVVAIGIASFSHQILALLIDNKELIRKADSYIGIIKYLMPIAGIFV